VAPKPRVRAARAGYESHAGQVFCCVGALAIADALHLVDRDLLCWWCAHADAPYPAPSAAACCAGVGPGQTRWAALLTLDLLRWWAASGPPG